MKRVGAACAAMMVTIVFAGALGAQGKTDPTLDKLAAQFEAAFNAQDAKKVAALYAEDAVAMPPNRPMIKGRAAIEADLQRDFKAGVSQLQIRPMESAIMGDRAYEAGTSTATVNGKPISGKYVVIYKRVGNDWKIAYDSYSADQPPPTQQKQ